MIPKTIIHLLSGGLDSVTMLYDLHGKGERVHALMFDYGQKHVQELQCAKLHCHRLNVLFTVSEIPQLHGSELTDGKGGVVVPNRNCILLSLAVNLAVSAGADTVTYACNADDESVFPDCRMAFLQSFNNMLRTQEVHVEVCAPYIDKPKWWIAGLAREMGIPIHETWSCYRGGAKPCGECAACKKLEAATACRECQGTGWVEIVRINPDVPRHVPCTECCKIGALVGET